MSIQNIWDNWKKLGPTEKLIQLLAISLVVLWLTFRKNSDNSEKRLVVLIKRLETKNDSLDNYNKFLTTELLNCERNSNEKFANERKFFLETLLHQNKKIDSLSKIIKY